MRLYHGSDLVTQHPKTGRSRKNLDFGPGFYATSIVSQAERWALRRSLRSQGRALVNIYEYDESVMLNTLRFTENDERWVNFVCECRRGESPANNADLIVGGVADDKVYAAVDMYVRGLWSMQETIDALSFYERNDQYCFVTGKAVSALTFLGSYEVRI